MFCPSCGEKIEDGSKFCTKCGNEILETPDEVVEPSQPVSVPPVEEPTIQQPSKLEKPKKEKPKKEKKEKKPKNKNVFVVIGIVIALLLAGGAGAAYFFLFRKTTIDLEKYAEITYSGYNGYGTASLEVDWDKLTEDYAGKLEFTSEGKKELESLGVLSELVSDDPVDYLEDSITAELDKKEELSNDDIIHITWDINKDLEKEIKVEFKYDNETEYTVSGLEKIEEADIFKDIKVKYSGMNGEGTVSGYECDDEDIQSHLSAEPSSNLSEGDKIIVTLDKDYIEQYSQKTGKKPKETSKEYTVTALDKYAEKLSDFSDASIETAKNVMKQVAEDRISRIKVKAGTDDVTYEYVGEYLQSPKGDNSKLSHKNIYGIVYKITVKRSQGTTVAYNALEFNNVIVSGDGEYDFGAETYTQFTNVTVPVDVLDYTLYGFDSTDALKAKAITPYSDTYNTDMNF